MAHRVGSMLVVGVLIFICTAPAARAESITITSGAVHFPWDDPSAFSVFGEGLALQSLFLRASSTPQLVCLTGCAPGTVVDMSASIGGPGPGTLGVALVAVINGVSHTEFGRPETLLDLSGTFDFDAPAVVLPPVGGAEGRIFVTSPFSFQGSVTGFRRDAPDVPRFQIDLDGVGTARLSFSIEPTRDRYILPEVTYEFSAVDPIPEPAALLLVGSGLAGLLVRRRRRSREAAGRS